MCPHKCSAGRDEASAPTSARCVNRTRLRGCWDQSAKSSLLSPTSRLGMVASTSLGLLGR